MEVISEGSYTYPMIRILSATLLLLLPLAVFSHGGGLDAYGCHNNRKQGGYHCHRGINAGKSYSSKSVMLDASGTPQEILSTPRPKNAPNSVDSISTNVLTGKVVGITDGDTLTMLVDNQQYKIRLAEIDTPERGQPYGSRAKQALSELAFGKEITAKVQDTDRYGRLVARLYVGEIDICAELISQGMAWVYRDYSTDISLFDKELQAKNEKRGLWSLPETQRIPPWEWRRR